MNLFFLAQRQSLVRLRPDFFLFFLNIPLLLNRPMLLCNSCSLSSKCRLGPVKVAQGPRLAPLDPQRTSLNDSPSLAGSSRGLSSGAGRKVDEGGAGTVDADDGAKGTKGLKELPDGVFGQVVLNSGEEKRGDCWVLWRSSILGSSMSSESLSPSDTSTTSATPRRSTPLCPDRSRPSRRGLSSLNGLGL